MSALSREDELALSKLASANNTVKIKSVNWLGQSVNMINVFDVQFIHILIPHSLLKENKTRISGRRKIQSLNECDSGVRPKWR